MDKRCEHCGGTMVTVRVDARFCTQKCGVYYRRKLAKLPRFPADLASKERFLRWKLVQRRGKWTKVPLTAAGGQGSSIDPSTWCSFAEARASDVGDGIGFVLGEGIGCIDLDDAIVDGAVLPWAQEIIDANVGTFMEVSHSGAGIHVWGLLDEARGRVVRDGRNIEVYSAERYIALGTPVVGTSVVLRPLVLPA